MKQRLLETLIIIYRWLKQQKRRFWDPFTRWPPIGSVELGDLRRLTPVSRDFGFDRGTPIDRYYIEKFLQQHSPDIRGRVLEIGDGAYTRRFGGDRVLQSDVLHVNRQKPEVTLVGDLARADHLPGDAFDCFIFTQTLQYIYEVRAAVRTIYRILKPGGVLLATFPGFSKITRPSRQESWEDYWRFSSGAARRLFSEVFPESELRVQAKGNVLAAGALLYGLAAEELRPDELEFQDPDFEVIITVRAAKM